MTDPKKGDLRVWWIPQVPMHPFYVYVDSIGEAALILETLTRYDEFQFENSVKPDYSNAGGLETFAGDEWEDWYDEESGIGVPSEYLAWRKTL